MSRDLEREELKANHEPRPAPCSCYDSCSTHSLRAPTTSSMRQWGKKRGEEDRDKPEPPQPSCSCCSDQQVSLHGRPRPHSPLHQLRCFPRQGRAPVHVLFGGALRGLEVLIKISSSEYFTPYFSPNVLYTWISIKNTSHINQTTVCIPN